MNEEKQIIKLTIENIQEIRRVLNLPLFRAKYKEDINFWNQMWASCDVLEDTNWGILYYFGSKYTGKDIGFKYLYLYGLLQLLYVQEDAIRHLSESLNYEIKPCDNEIINEIRIIRNCTIGHPTKSGRDRYYTINQNSINKTGFSYFEWNKTREMKSANIIEIIRNQYKWVNDCLSLLLIDLEKEWDEMCEVYRKCKLTGFFSNDMEFRLEKLLTYDPIMALNFGYQGIKGIFDNIIKEITNRYGTYELPGTQELIKELSHILEYFNNVLTNKNDYDEIQYSLYGELLRTKLKELKKSCIEIDKDAETGLKKQ